MWLREQLARRPLLQPGQRSMVEQLLPLAGEAPVWQPRISDAAWRAVSALLPPLSHSGGRRRCERQILEAIVHIACTKTTWRRLPRLWGPLGPASSVSAAGARTAPLSASAVPPARTRHSLAAASGRLARVRSAWWLRRGAAAGQAARIRLSRVSVGAVASG
ncbi:hypothetical protein C4B68_39955 [Streptomyces dengpaensis]|uniref:Insertion element IS402-like domain-containing protein n=1 Tax=Streptomyces dengpaensis TaxID=2049881 RepID=A0ABM6T220_9ACTN|nr:hypothetical protein C4B68_39955 [Streptomyces dengpaensis]